MKAFSTPRAVATVAAAVLTIGTLGATTTSAIAGTGYGHLDGYAVSPDGTQMIPHATVRLYRNDGTGVYQRTDYAGTTDANGHYDITAPSAGTYHVRLDDVCNVLQERILGNTDGDIDHGTDVKLAEDDTTRIDLYFLRETANLPDLPCLRRAPTITGLPRVGFPLQGDTGVWAQSDVTYSFQWYDQTTNLPVYEPGTDTARLTPSAKEQGHGLFLRVTAHRKGADGQDHPASTDVTTGAIQPRYRTFTSVPTPVVSGLPTVGATLRAASGAAVPPAIPSYQWMRNGAPIPGATGPSYKVAAADRGRSLSVSVQYSAYGFAFVTKVAEAAFTVRKLAKEQAKAKGGHRKVTFKVAVSPQASTHHRGTVTVRDETGHKVASVSIKSGSVTFTAKRLTRGRHRFTVLYLSHAYASQKTVTVTIK